MRWPHPCFVLLTGNNNRLTQRAAHHQASRRRIESPYFSTTPLTLPLPLPQLCDNMEHQSPMELSAPPGVDGASPPLDKNGLAVAVAVAQEVATNADSTSEIKMMPDNVKLLGAVTAATLLGRGSLVETKANKQDTNTSEGRQNGQQAMDISVPGDIDGDGSGANGATQLPLETVEDLTKEESNMDQQQQAMDISIPGDCSINNGPTTNNHSMKSPLDSVEETKAEEETDVAKPLLHEHHPSLSNQSSDSIIADNDIEMSPSRSSIRSCRSIEEASVNTTIESVTMEEFEKTLNDTTVVETEDQSHDEVLPPASSDISETVAVATAESQSLPFDHHNVKLRLTPEEERLFQLLTNAAEAYEAGELTIDPNPTQSSVSARGGFTKQESAGEDGASWLKLPPQVERIEIRVAGGWVRDKLLNQHSVDVDVALDCMMGVQFARIVQSYMALQHEKEEKQKSSVGGGEGVNGDSEGMKIENKASGQSHQEMEQPSPDKGKKNAKQKKKEHKTKNKQPKIGVIGANPSQSKHLETATMNIHGIDVDFVNLRAEEVYESNSRIPTSETRMFGTPLEDALRRDFTINSLFYNIRSHKIEDWTGRGLDDLLQHRRIVTPVDPHVTFHDDPLRVLRAIRFCVRLDFTLDDTIKEAAMSKRVHHSLHVKVSRERVGKELEGMLTGKHARPGRALHMIAELHLAGSVFAFPGSFPGEHDYAGGPVSGDILGATYNCSVGTDSLHAIERAAKQRAKGWDESSSLLALLPTVMEGHIDEREKIFRNKDNQEGIDDGNVAVPLPSTVDTRLLHLCVFILPFHNLTFPDKKGRAISVTAQMIKEALKFPIRDIQAVSKILSHVDEMVTILSEIRSQLASQQVEEGGGAPLRLTLLCRLRAGLLLRSLKENWITCLLTAAAWEIRSYQKQQHEDAQASTLTSSIPSEQPSREFYRAVVEDLDLDECWRVRPHLNGKDIIKELSLPKGPLVGVYLDYQTRWMLLNPEGTKEQCMSHLQERKREREQEGSRNKDENDPESVMDDQNEVNVGIVNEGGHPAQIAVGEGSKHFSKKIRADG